MNQENNNNSKPTEPTQPLESENFQDEEVEGRGFSEDPLERGERVGGYEVKEKIGIGGMSVVYRAYDESLDREVALKILPEQLETDGNSRKRFIREARSAASLNHPNIVQVYSAGEENGGAYMAMEFVEGRSLDDLIRENESFDTDQAIKITEKIATALQEAHGNGIIHRDIKPSNILISMDGQVKVADFGLSRGITSNTRITRTGTYLGTPAYSSPEQCESRDLDERSDIYSLGAVLYEMLTGKIPHEADTPLSMMKKIIENEPRSIRKFKEDIPEEAVRVVQKMLAKDRDERYQDTKELIEDLEQLQKGEVPTVASSQPVSGQKSATGTQHIFDAPPAKTLGILAVPALLLLLGFLIVPSFLPKANDGNTNQDQTNQQTRGKNGDVPMGGPSSLHVATLDFANGTQKENKEWMKIGIPDLLISQLSQVKDLHMFTRSEMLQAANNLEPEMGEKGNGMKSSSGQLRQLKNNKQIRQSLMDLGADIVLMGSYYMLPSGRMEINAKVFSLKTNSPRPLKRLGIVRVGGNSDNLFSMVDELAKKLINKIYENRQTTVAAADSDREPTFEKSSEEMFASNLPLHIEDTYGIKDEEPEEGKKNSKKRDAGGGLELSESDRKLEQRSVERKENNQLENRKDRIVQRIKSRMVKHFMKNRDPKLRGKLLKKFCEAKQAKENREPEKLERLQNDILKMMIKNESTRKQIKVKIKKFVKSRVNKIRESKRFDREDTDQNHEESPKSND